MKNYTPNYTPSVSGTGLGMETQTTKVTTIEPCREKTGFLSQFEAPSCYSYQDIINTNFQSPNLQGGAQWPGG